MRRTGFACLCCTLLSVAVVSGSVVRAPTTPTRAARASWLRPMFGARVPVIGSSTHRASSTRARTTSASIMFGRRSVASSMSASRSGVARAFPFRSRVSGTVSSINVYFDRRSHARRVLLGLYSSAIGMPRIRLTSGSIGSAKAGTWNSARVRHVAVTSGTTYWLVVLGHGGPLYFRHGRAGSCTTRTAYEKHLVSLPRTWKGGTRDSMCRLSAYVNGTPKARPTHAPVDTGAGGGAGSGSASSPVTSPPSQATIVGYAGAPAPTCSTVVSAGADPSSALASASRGETVCLADGTWPGNITISQASPGVTLAAEHPGGASVPGVSITANTSNLTVEGLRMSGGFSLTANVANDSFLYNTMENWTGDQGASAVFAYPGPSGTDSGVKVEYNQIDHAPQCLQIDQPTSITGQVNWTFSHNVCGPDIGNGNNDTHYIQAECVDGITIDNNAFEGPINTAVFSNGSHTNILHSCGDNLVYANNIEWESDAEAQSVLIGDDGTVSGLTVTNNLDVQDPGYCDAYAPTGCPAVSIWSDGSQSTSNVVIDNNTTYNPNSPPSNLTNPVAGGVWAAGSMDAAVVTAKNNIMATRGPVNDYAFASGDSTNANVSADSTGNIPHWSPCWQDTSWPGTNQANGPNDGSPWVPPPSGYFKPVTSGGCANHGVTSVAGYQGTVGP